MEIIIKAFKVKGIENIEEFNAKVTNRNYLLARGNQEIQYQKIVELLKELQDLGFIKSIKRPKNKKIQKQLDLLIKTKKEIKNSLKKLKAFK